MKRFFLYTFLPALSCSMHLSAESSKQLQLLYFTASWCGPCQLMKQDTWPNNLVKKELEAFTFQSIDVDKEKKITEKWSVRSMPTYLIVDPNGEIELARMSGFMDAFRMSAWLKEINAHGHQTLDSIAEARKIAAESWAQVELLSRPDLTTEDLITTQTALFSLLQQRGEIPESTAKELDTRLHSIAGSHPEYLLSGILHKDLQVRACVARALSAHGIHLDPWANENDRAKAYKAYPNIRSK